MGVPELKQAAYRTIDKALAVARAENFHLDREGARDEFHQITAATGDNKSSPCVDVVNQRPTEVDCIYGPIIRLGRQHGIDTPVLQSTAAVAKRAAEPLWRLTRRRRKADGWAACRG